MDPRDFLNIATAFHSSPHEEYRRTAVSRAYYALYLTAHQILEAEGLSIPRSGPSHIEVPRYLKDSGDRDAGSIADALMDLYNDRIQADYRMTETRFTPNTCALIVAKARLHLGTVSRWDAAAKKQLAARIKSARRLP